jgi:hypothetical protein
MSKLLFKPVSVVTGIVAGLIARKLFGGVWRAVDSEPAPKPDERRTSLGKLALALALEGALFRVVKGLADNGSRRVFTAVVGTWPGERRREVA